VSGYRSLIPTTAKEKPLTASRALSNGKKATANDGLLRKATDAFLRKASTQGSDSLKKAPSRQGSGTDSLKKVQKSPALSRAGSYSTQQKHNDDFQSDVFAGFTQIPVPLSVRATAANEDSHLCL
jgi:hypothetical protein